MVHITALALFHAAPPPRLPRSEGMEPFPACALTSWGILGGVPPRPTRLHMGETAGGAPPPYYYYFSYL